MEWAAIVKEFLEIGLLGLCGCVVIYAVLNNFKLKNQRIEKEAERVDNKENKDEDRFDKMLEAMQQQNKEYQEMMMGQFQMMSENIINGVINHVPSDEENAKITKVSAEVDNYLAEMLDETGADRVALVQYHNGGRGINRQSFLKMSMSNEQVALGIKPLMPEFRDQFRSVLGIFIRELDEKGYCYIDDVEDLKNRDNAMYEFMNNRGVKSKYGIAIRNKNKYTIGFICIEYNDIDKRQPDKVRKAFEQKQQAIEALLNL